MIMFSMITAPITRAISPTESVVGKALTIKFKAFRFLTVTRLN